MTIDEAIKNCEETARINREISEVFFGEGSMKAVGCLECAKKHEQIAEWLKDYKRMLDMRGKEECD